MSTLCFVNSTSWITKKGASQFMVMICRSWCHELQIMVLWAQDHGPENSRSCFVNLTSWFVNSTSWIPKKGDSQFMIMICTSWCHELQIMVLWTQDHGPENSRSWIAGNENCRLLTVICSLHTCELMITDQWTRDHRTVNPTSRTGILNISSSVISTLWRKNSIFCVFGGVGGNSWCLYLT